MVSSNIAPLNRFPAVDEAVARLVSCDVLNGRYRIGMPVAMGTGTLVDVSVWPEPGGSFLVSDGGIAHLEITSSAYSERIFSKVARDRCARYGATFDGATMLFFRVPADRLRGAIISMASLAKEVVDETIMRATRIKVETARDALFERLDKAFGSDRVTHDAIIVGESTAEYHVDAEARLDGRLVVFDLFTDDANSIASTFTKLSDIYRRENAPGLVGVTRNPDRVGPKLQLISSVANVIRLDAAADKFRRLAA